MRSKLVTIFVVVLACGLLATPALAQKMICITDPGHQGDVSISECIAAGHEFAVIDQFGVPRILSKNELGIFKKLNPTVFEGKSYSIPYIKMAPEIPQIKDYFAS